MHQELKIVLEGPQAVSCCFRFFISSSFCCFITITTCKVPFSWAPTLPEKSNRENLNASKEQLCLEVSPLCVFTWEDSSCFLSECSCGCLDFPLLVLLKMSEGHKLIYSVLFLRVFGNNLFMSYSRVGQSMALDLWRNGLSKSVSWTSL